MRSFFKTLFIVIICFFTHVQCEEEGLGLEYSLENDISTNYEEFILPTSSVYSKDLVSNVNSQVFVGNYSSEKYGNAYAEAYVKLTLADNTAPGDSIENDFVLENATFSLISPQSTVDGNLGEKLSFDIFELEEDLITGITYLSSKSEIHKTDTLAKLNGVIRTDTTYISGQVNDDFKAFLRTYLTDDDVTTLPSLVIKPKKENEVINIFSLANDTSRLYLHFKDTSDRPNNRDTSYIVSFRFSTLYYSHIQRDFSTSELSGITEKADFFTQDSASVIDPLLGLSTNIDLSPLVDFFTERNDITVIAAKLVYEYEDDTRPLLPLFYKHFRKEDKSFLTYGAFLSSYENAILTDNVYLNNFSQGNRLLSQYSTDTSRIVSSINLFSQTLYSEFQERGTLSLVNPSDENTVVPISSIVLFPINSLTINRTIFKKGSIKLGIYFSKFDL